MLQDKKGKVLTLIYQNHQGKLVVEQQTLRHISTYKGQYSFLSICGEYRTGKSFLLNSLFFDYEGFRTSGTTEACTKGINIWSQPVKYNGHLIWLLDTQGFGSIDKDSNYDGKIFLITLLISNILLYNSFGAIDENIIAKLALICQQAKFLLSKTIQISLFWVLRDFSLEMVDKEGKQLTQDQYLQECLKQGNIKGQKQLLKKVFQERHCVTLIRPVIDEAKLNNLHEVDKIQLRQEFKQQIHDLRKRLQKSVKSKKIEGVTISDKNIKIVMSQFTQLMNKSELQWDLNCSYERVKNYQIEMLKQKLIEMIHNKVQNLKKLLPVKQDHIQYLSKEISQLLAQELLELKEFRTKNSKQLLQIQLKQIVREEIEKVQKINIESIAQQIKDYLYRRVIQLYPQIIVLNHSQLENKLQESLTQLKQIYSQKYSIYFKNQRYLEYFYSVSLQKQIRKLFYELTKRWKNQQKQFENKIQQLKKLKKNVEQQLKRNKQQKEKSIKSLEMYRRQEGRSLSKIKQEIQTAFKQEMTTIVKDYEQKLIMAEETKEKLQKQFRNQQESNLQEKTALMTNWQYQKQGLLQKIQLQKQKWQMTNIKYEQLKSSFDLEMQQYKNSYENKLKIMEMKCNETSNTLSTQRRKFQMLSEQRRVQQNQLLNQIQEQNQQIHELTNQLKELQIKYKNELEKILSEEKQILVKTITNKIQQYQYKCKVYQGKLQQAALSLKDLQFYSQKNDELQIQVREFKSKLEDQSDKNGSLQNKMCKMEIELSQQQEYIENLKAEFEKQISLANQNLFNNKKFIKEAEQRQKEEIQYYKRKIQTQLSQQSSHFASTHEENIRQNKVILQQKFDKERTQLKDIIKNNYEEIETLKLQKSILDNQLQKIYNILTEIKKSHQIKAQQSKMTSLYEQQDYQNSYQLANIIESPQEYSRVMNNSDKKQKIQKMHFMAEQIFEINESLQQQIKIFGIQREALKKQLDLYAQKADSYEVNFNKASNQNRQLKSQVQDLRKKNIAYENLKKTSQLIEQKYKSIQKQLTLLKKEIQIKNTMYQQRQQSMKQNTLLYKQTISQLSQENRLITQKLKAVIQKNNNLEAQLQRFNLWAQEVQSKESIKSMTNLGNRAYSSQSLDAQVNKIQDLQNQIKRLTKRSQQNNKYQKQARRESLLSSYLAENRGQEIQDLRRQNQNLYKRLQAIHQQQLRQMQEKKHNRKKQLQLQESKYITIKQQYQQYKRKAKQIISQLEAHLQNQIQQNNSLKKQFKDMEQNIIKKYQFQMKHALLQIQSLKHDKETSIDLYSKKVSILNEEINAKSNEYDRKLAQTQLKYEREREEIEKQQNKIILESERHRLKYQHLLKVNNQLIKQIQDMKSKAHQITLKEKYKAKIANLFTN